MIFNATLSLSVQAPDLGEATKKWDALQAFASEQGFLVEESWIGEGPRVVDLRDSEAREAFMGKAAA